jgi:signal transduction histidine kinase/ActR/RegA family two-component response regulator
VQWLLPARVWPYLNTGLGHYLLLMGTIMLFLGLLLGLLYDHELRLLADEGAAALAPTLKLAFVKAFAALSLVAGILAWWLVLTHKSRQVAQEESNRQTHLLMQEIESHRRTDEQLQQAKQVADLANQAKSRYITAISHELRTPLNSILGYAQILDGDESIPPHRRQAVNVIRRSGDHLLSVIEGTLDIARIEGGRLSLEVKPLDFPDFLQQIVRMFELQAASKGLAFHFEPRGKVPAVVRADQKRLRQILINILGNAVKFTREGGITLRLAYARELATFEIEDTGPGISAPEMERIFEPFARGDAAASASGAGLGLTISRMFADVMGGQLSVDSTPGQGSRFTVRLYLPEMHGAQAARELPRANRIGYAGPRRRILVVDNEKVDRELLIGVLEPLGFILEEAASGHECLARLADFQPDLIFMDLAMPGIDGWETIRRIRRDHVSEAAIAVISANAYDKGLPNDAGLAAEDFILKPVKVTELLDWIGQRLNLEWLEAGAAPPAPAVAPAALTWPEAADLQALGKLVELGYVRGILAKLDEIEARTPDCGGFTTAVRELVRQFQLDAVQAFLGSRAHA